MQDTQTQRATLVDPSGPSADHSSLHARNPSSLTRHLLPEQKLLGPEVPYFRVWATVPPGYRRNTGTALERRACTRGTHRNRHTSHILPSTGSHTRRQ